jgi:hypothetical protein
MMVEGSRVSCQSPVVGVSGEVIGGQVRMADQLVVAFGPVMPGWRSWQWIGDDIRQELAEHFQTISFDAKEIPESDVAVFVKFAPPLNVVELSLSGTCSNG